MILLIFREFHTFMCYSLRYSTSPLLTTPESYLILSALCPPPCPLLNDPLSICHVQSHGCGIIYSSVVDLPVATALEKIESPSAGSYQQPVIPLLVLGSPAGLSSCWSCNQSCCEFSDISKRHSFCCSSSLPLALMFPVPPLLRNFLNLRGRNAI